MKGNSTVLTVCRGLLSAASGNEDDPFDRVILRRLAGGPQGAGAAPLKIPGAVSGESADLRDKIKSLIASHAENHGGAAPDAVVLPDNSAWQAGRQARAAGEPLRNKVALVTGAAGAIGAGICKALLEKGCHVAATDLVQESLDELVQELKAAAGDMITGVRVDVTDKASVAAGFDRVAETWGGVDIVVVNAGIAAVGSLVDMELEAFRKAEKVNVEGTLLTISEAGRRLTEQGTGGDIVLISTKNVFAPGAQFGAYSATKAASHQLARIASLELAQFGIRVNMVAPDAVFSEGKRKSGLWAEVGPSRMKARGLDEKGLEEYYRNRNLLKARVTAAHVANAVLFFVTRQTPTTGATIPVDGGLPDATPR